MDEQCTIRVYMGDRGYSLCEDTKMKKKMSSLVNVSVVGVTVYEGREWWEIG